MILVSVGFADGNPVVAILHVQSQQIFYTSQYGFQEFCWLFSSLKWWILLRIHYTSIYIYMFQTLKWEMYRILPILFIYVYRHMFYYVLLKSKMNQPQKPANPFVGFQPTRPGAVRMRQNQTWHAMNRWILVGGFLGSLAFMVPMIIPSFMTV